MELSEQTLREIIAGIPCGDAPPYSDGSPDDIEDFLRQVVREIGNSRTLRVEADFSHYGSGYASYVDVFCWKKDGSTQRQESDSIITQGIALYLCRLAPFAILARDERAKHSSGGSWSFVRPNSVDSIPTGEWADDIYAIKTKLGAAGIEVLRRELVEQPLGFEADIRTIVNEGRYTVFDALFYWED